MHHLYAALRAHALYHRDQHYVVQNGEVIIVDEFTGRLMPGRRWSDGLHQAVEAKEGVSIQNENQTLASITFQNYFRLYKKLAGMTGTADTEAFEFQSIYGLETVRDPDAPADGPQGPERPGLQHRQGEVPGDHQGHEGARRQRGQPVLVGTTSIENSELSPACWRRTKLPHNVLNAKQHAREAEIVAQAGRPAQVTIATNMAGRGTDIVLGGNPEARDRSASRPTRRSTEAEKAQPHRRSCSAELAEAARAGLAAGGLHIIGTERHESRRIDNQLRGRSGRQGDPGPAASSCRCEDRCCASSPATALRAIMQPLKMPEGEAIEHRW